MQTIASNITHNLPLFAGLNEQEKDVLVQAGRLRRYAKGENLFVYGDDVQHFYIICDGAVQLFRETPDGHEMTSDVFIAGDTIGDTEILQAHPTHQANAISVKDTVVFETPIAWLKDNVKRHSILALNLLASLTRRTLMASIEVEHRSTMSAPQQVACFLERLCLLHDLDPHGFDLPYSKTLIASRLGMELETLSRAFAKLRDHGITVKGMHVSFDSKWPVEKHFSCGSCSMNQNCPAHKVLSEKLLACKHNHAARA